MPLPVLKRDDFTPTGQTLPISDYFNPTKNPEFYQRIPSRAINGTMKVSEIEAIAKALATPEAIDDLIPLLFRNYNISDTPMNRAAYRAVYDLLPEDQRWLIFWTPVYYQSEPVRNVYKYQVHFRSFENVAYHEIGITKTNIILYITGTSNPFDSDCFFSVTPAHCEQFLVDVTSNQNTTSKMLHDFSSFADSDVNYNDGNCPSIIGILFRYASGTSCFFPHSSRDNMPVVADWTTPHQLKTYYDNEDYRCSWEFSSNCTRLVYNVKPKAGSRSSISRILNYSTNVFDYLPYTIKGPKEPAATLYGVELEACGDYTPQELVAAQKDLFFIMKQDGSIFGNKRNKYELVTVPASLRAHKRLWAEFFEKVDYTKFDTTKDTGNGMHVHIGRSAFSKTHLNKFTWFIVNPAHEDFILLVSERPTKNNLKEWAPTPNMFGWVSKITASQVAASANNGIRGAVHYKSNKTVEVRLFKGIVSYATVVKNLEFVDSVFEYTRQTPLCQLSLRNYLAWLDATPKNKYQMLKTFFTEARVPTLLLGAELTEYLWSADQDHVLEDKLNKAPFKITNAHITYLNKKRRKRIFILKDGRVICVRNNGGLLAKLDKSMQQKQTRGAATFALSEFAA